jgi:archaellum component FlaC
MVDFATVLAGYATALGLIISLIVGFANSIKDNYGLKRDVKHLQNKYSELSAYVIELENSLNNETNSRIEKLEDYEQINRVLLTHLYVRLGEPINHLIN